VRRIVAVIAFIALALVLGAPIAIADAPGDALRAAVDKTSHANSARLTLTQKTTSGARALATTASGTLAGSDVDVVVSTDGGATRRIAKDTAVYEQRPANGAAPWKQTTRAQPTTTTPFGALTLNDGTSVGDPKLYVSITDQGTEALPQGQARKLVGQLDLNAVGTAMQLGPSERARLAQMSATVTTWIGADGAVARHVLTLVVPGADGPTTLETTVDLTDLNAPLTISAP
jgi:hypothetical protein